MKRMTKLPIDQLNYFVDLAETELRTGGTITQMVNKIENGAYNRGFKVDRKEVRNALIEKLALEVAKELRK